MTEGAVDDIDLVLYREDLLQLFEFCGGGASMGIHVDAVRVEGRHRVRKAA